MNKIYKLTDVVNFIGGSQPPKSIFSDEKKDGYIRLIQIRDYKSDDYIVYIPKDSTKKFCTEDDIMIGRYGPPVFQILRGINGAYNVALMKAEPKTDKLSKEYLFRFLQNPSIQNYIIGLSQRSAGQSGVNKEALEEYEFLLPPLSEQQRIVSKLDLLFVKIDKSIALHQKNMDEADVFMGSVLNDVFGELEEKYPKVELTKYVKFNGGSQPPKSDFSDIELDGYVRLIQIRDYKTDNYIVYVDKNSVKKFCRKDDVMIGRYGPPVFQILRGIEGAYNVALMKAEPNEDIISKDFLFEFLKNSNIQNYIIGLSQRSAGQSGVNKEALEKYPISIPPLQIQQKVVKYLDKISEKIEKVKSIQKEKMDSLKSLKASILDKAFRGEL